MDKKRDFADRLKELREEGEYNMTQIAKGIGVTQTTIMRWEAGLRKPLLEQAVQLAKFFDVTVGYMAGVEDM